MSLPSALPLPPLKPSSLRVQSSLLSLTTNNLTYARIGHLLGWWDFHPLPSSIPAKFSDPKAYGRISAWGYGTIIESSTFGIEVGTQIYGYLPIGTLPVDMNVKFDPTVPGRVQEVSEHRSKLLPIYNRYFFHPKAATAQDKTGQGYDSLIRVLFETGFMINRFVFGWEPSEVVHPGAAGGAWTYDKARIDGATVLLFSASGKTSLSLAHQLKYGRPASKKPAKVVAVGSKFSKSFTEGTELYDQVLDYAADQHDLENKLGLNAESKIVVCDFGSRDAAATRWVEKLKKTYKNVIFVSVGGEVVPDDPEKALRRYMAGISNFDGAVNASGLRDAGISILGEEKYFDDFYKDWNQCKDSGGFKGLKLVWGEGMEQLGNAWEKLCEDKVGADEGLVFSLGNDYSEDGEV